MSDTEPAPVHRTDDTRDLRASPSDDGRVRATIRPGDTVGRYQILGLIGAGGMGQVFRALDPELGRTVALKVIRPDGKIPSALDRARFLREAQALAKLQHSNVVAIHDVGMHLDQVFIAMEHVAGPTLDEWLKSAPRPWRAVRDVFVAAGRGLAVAHAAGIVHRDFKPSNVIVGADRVVVVDFGLARAHGDDDEVAVSSSGTILDVSLTLTGERVGTLLYMAPEQLRGEPVSALADQFGLATSMWTALYGVPPFTGITGAELLQDMAHGPTPPPSDRDVPQRTRAALARALSIRPSDRWPALSELLAELTHDPVTVRRRALAFAAAAIAIVAIAAPVAYLAGRRAIVPSCAPPATALWDDATRAEVRAAFLATGRSYALDSFDRVDAALRVRLAALGQAREETCAATEIRHEQSAALMDARMACLARAGGQIAAFVEVLKTADGRGVERATSAAAAAGELEPCAEITTPASASPASRDPRTAATVAALEAELARVRALLLVGRMGDAEAAAPALVERARALGHPSLLGRVLFAVSTPGCEAGDPRAASAALYEGARAAGAAHDDVLATQIAIKLLYCAGAKDANLPAAQALVETAEAALARIGSPLDLRARLYREEARLRRHAGDLVNAFGLAELALMSYTRLYGESSGEAAPSFGDLGDILTALGAYPAALAAYGRAVPVLERTRGPSHPLTATYVSNMGMAAAESGDLDGAAASFARALAIEEQNGAEQAGMPSILRNLADVRERQGRLEDAGALVRRARAIDERTRRPEHPAFGRNQLLLATLAADRGALDEARRLAEGARAVFAKAYGPDHPLLADVDLLSSRIAHRRHDLGGARRLAGAALALHRKTLGPRHPAVAADEGELGAILLEAGEAAAALPLLEEALAIEEAARNDDAGEVVAARARLAAALLAGGDRGRATSLAQRAVATAGAGRLRADLEGQARFTLARALAASDRGRALDLAHQARALLAGSRGDEVARLDRQVARW